MVKKRKLSQREQRRASAGANKKKPTETGFNISGKTVSRGEFEQRTNTEREGRRSLAELERRTKDLPKPTPQTQTLANQTAAPQADLQQQTQANQTTAPQAGEDREGILGALDALNEFNALIGGNPNEFGSAAGVLGGGLFKNAAPTGSIIRGGASRGNIEGLGGKFPNIPGSDVPPFSLAPLIKDSLKQTLARSKSYVKTFGDDAFDTKHLANGGKAAKSVDWEKVAMFQQKKLTAQKWMLGLGIAVTASWGIFETIGAISSGAWARKDLLDARSFMIGRAIETENPVIIDQAITSSERAQDFIENDASKMPFMEVIDIAEFATGEAPNDIEIWKLIAEDSQSGESVQEFLARRDIEKQAQFEQNQIDTDERIRRQQEDERLAKEEQRDADAAFWRREQAKARQQEAAERNRIAEFWLAYRKKVNSLQSGSAPSKLTFGLL